MRVLNRLMILLVASGLLPFGMWFTPSESAKAAYDPSAQNSVVANGQTYTLFIQGNGTVKAGGYEASTGALGQGSFTGSNYSSPITVPGIESAVQVAAFGYSSYALLSDGTVKSWGQNNNGQLGLGHTSNVHTPTTIPGLINVKQVVAGNGFGIALLRDGTLKGWGLNDYGQLLNNGSSNAPIVMSAITNVNQIAAGDKFLLALKSNGQVYSCGYNNSGQLGNGSTTNATAPQIISGLSGIRQIAAGAAFGIALQSDGTIASWGNNANGQLGHGNQTNRTTPMTISSFNQVRYIAAGSGSALVIRNDDSLWTWGNNNNGQLGHADLVNRSAPHKVNLDFRISHGYIGSGNVLFISDYSLNVYGAGTNGTGQLATGSTNNQNQFTLTPGLSVASYLMQVNPSVTTVHTSIFADNYSSSSFLIENGTVFGWGNNNSGQLTGSGMSAHLLSVDIGIKNTKSISSGADHTLALLNDGTVRSRGQNSSGQLGVGNTTSYTDSVIVSSLSNVKQVAAGDGFSLALMNDGTVRAWGRNSSGQLGLGNTTSVNAPMVIPGLQNVKHITAGAAFVLAVLSDDTVVGWGDNGSGQLGLGNSISKLSPTPIPNLTGVNQVFTGAGHSFALMMNGTVKAWGRNSSGQLGIGHTSNINTPTLVPGLQNVIKLDAGDSFSLALIEGGDFFAWGDSAMGFQSTPKRIAEMFQVADIAAGRLHALVLTGEGALYAWGNNSSGQLGTGDSYYRAKPKSIPRLSGIVDIAVGPSHQTMVLTEEGAIYSWGENHYSNLGVSSPTGFATPTKFQGVSEVQQVSLNSTHTLAILRNGKVMGWGLSDNGQVGSGFVLSPTLIPGLESVKQVIASGSISLALLQNGTVKSWGGNSIGQLGLSDTTNRNMPTLIPGLTGVQQIASNGYSTAALMSDGTVKVWGRNSSGELGIGNSIAQSSPITIPGLTGVKQISVGYQFMLALLNNGSVLAWGANQDGMLGQSDTTSRNTPTTISGLSNVRKVATGWNQAFAIMEDGTVKAWGDNDTGQLGTGDTARRLSPTLIVIPQNIVTIGASMSHSMALLSDGTLLAWGDKSMNALADPVNPLFPQPINRYLVNSAIVKATVEGPIADEVSVSYRLNDEPTIREFRTSKLHGGATSVLFEPLNLRELSTGHHNLIMNAKTAYQSTESTATFFNGIGFANDSLRLTAAAITGLSVIGTSDDVASSLDSNPFRLSIGEQTSGWKPYSPSGANHTFTGLHPNTQYTVRLDVKSLTGEVRSIVETFSTLPEVPQLSMETAADGGRVFTITDNNPSHTQYQLVINGKYFTGEGSLVADPSNLSLPSKKIVIRSLDPNRSYSIKVRALNGDGVVTDWSAAIQIGKPTIPPAAPKQIKLQPTSTSIQISWSPVSEANSYEIEADNASTPIAIGKVLNYKHQSLTPNTLHQYRVRALKDGVVGPWSAPIMQRTLMVAPVVPVNIVASATAKTATVTWNAVQDALSYEVEWDGQLISVGKQQTFKQNGLPLSSRHAFRVRALNAGGAGPWSTVQIISTTSSLPSVPAIGTPSVSNKSVQLRWQPAEDALAYEIEADGIVLGVNEALTAAFTGLSPGTSHQYRVRALNELGAGEWSTVTQVTTNVLATPSGITDTVSDTSIKLTWSAVAGATSYEIEANGQVVNAPSSQQLFEALQPESVHTYRVRAIGAAGNSAWTEPFVLTTLPLKPDVPQQISATASKDQVFLSWGAVVGAHGYDVELDGVVIVNNFMDTRYSDRLLDPFTQHQYRIRARTDAIEGDWSELITLRTLPEKPKTPSDILVTSAANIVTLSWAQDPTVTKYEVEIDGQVLDAGNKAVYKHRRVAQGSEHKYRIRTINVSGVGEWSGYIINNTIVAKLTKTNTVDMGMVGKDIMDFSRYTLKVTYDPNAIEITDLSTLTGSKELTTGRIPGTDVIVASFRPGEAVFTCDKAIAVNESWTGVINSIQMKAKVSGGSSITYSVVEQPL